MFPQNKAIKNVQNWLRHLWIKQSFCNRKKHCTGLQELLVFWTRNLSDLQSDDVCSRMSIKNRVCYEDILYLLLLFGFYVFICFLLSLWPCTIVLFFLLPNFCSFIIFIFKNNFFTLCFLFLLFFRLPRFASFSFLPPFVCPFLSQHAGVCVCVDAFWLDWRMRTKHSLENKFYNESSQFWHKAQQATIKRQF